MTQLYGTSHDQQSLAAHTGRLSQCAGVRLVTLADGAGRGVRLLEFETGSGLRFDVALDRAMDIATMSHNGRAIGWQSPVGIKHPAFVDHEGEDGLGWTRGFSGMLSTCGLDHILGPEEVSAESYNYPRKARMRHGLHGRIAMAPAQLKGYGCDWQEDKCILWAAGLIEQTTVFGEVLHLHRRIEADLGGNTLRLADRVENAGFSTTPHMMMYHFNLGYPVVDAAARYLAPIGDVVWAAHDLRAQQVGYRTCPAPVVRFGEQVWQHQMISDAAGQVPVAVVNDRIGLGVEITSDAAQLPCAFQWQNFQAGHYVMGVEPSTHHIKGNQFARDRDEMIWLRAGEDRRYDLQVQVLDGADEIAGAEARIQAIASQPDTDFPTPSGDFVALHQGARAE